MKNAQKHLIFKYSKLYRKSLSLRQTKADKIDTFSIASMLVSDVNLRFYSDTSYHNEELKSLTRYRFDKVKERAKLKSSVSRLVCILFPELERLVPTLHMASVYWHPSMLCFVNFQVQMLLEMHISQGFPTYSLIVRKADMEKILLSCFVTLQEVLSVLICLPSL